MRKMRNQVFGALFALAGICCAEEKREGADEHSRTSAKPGSTQGPEFVGVITAEESVTLYGLIANPGAPVGWFKNGEEFQGYRITDYRPKDEILVLRKKDGELLLKLKEAKVRARGTEAVEHVVVRGDSLFLISKKTGVPIKRLKELNPQLKGPIINIGDRIRVQE
jgi:LysM repeat protein